jgi:hypothetical protein
MIVEIFRGFLLSVPSTCPFTDSANYGSCIAPFTWTLHDIMIAKGDYGEYFSCPLGLSGFCLLNMSLLDLH